ncbi:UNVERIFIED_CONTAM: hypothetical protein Cloal_2025 [Acetivibrio alkalicellulosi]
MKRVSKIIIILTFLFFSSACERNDGNNPIEHYNNAVEIEESRFYEKEDKAMFLVSNGIMIKDLEKNVYINDIQAKLSFPQIEGLKDSALQEELNNSIIEDIVKELAENDLYNAYYNITLNSNNLLCFNIYNHNNTEFSVRTIAGFLYRLTDGKRLSLVDIFTKGTDYINLINDYVPISILSSGLDEEEIFKRPFLSIKADQNFSISDSNLQIIFRPEEGVFLKYFSANIPLVEIDDYVEVMDLYQKNEESIYIYDDMMVHKNNIFLTQRINTYKRTLFNKELNVNVRYYEIGGLRDEQFQTKLNETIISIIEEMVKSNYLDNLEIHEIIPEIYEEDYRNSIYSSLKFANRHNLNIDFYTLFNNYGILSFNSSYGIIDNSFHITNEDFNKLISFDLIGKKSVNLNEIIKYNAKRYEGFKEELVNICLEKLEETKGFIEDKSQTSIDYINNINKLIDQLDFDYIIENSSVSFYCWGEPIYNIGIGFIFNDNFKYPIHISVSLSDFSKITLRPEQEI